MSLIVIWCFRYVLYFNDLIVFFKQKTAYELRISDWSSDVCSSDLLFNFKALLDQHQDELAALITAEHGKVFSDAKGEVVRGIEVVEFACAAPQLLKGQYTDQIGGGIDNWSMRQPLGGVAGITPFQSPMMVPGWWRSEERRVGQEGGSSLKS